MIHLDTSFPLRARRRRSSISPTARVLLAAALGGAVAARSAAVITHDVDIGTGSVAAGSTITLTVGPTVAAGDLLLVETANNSNSVVPIVTDSRGNTHFQGLVNTTGTGLITVGFAALVTTALISGDTITVSFPSAVDGVASASAFAGAEINGGVAANHNSGSSVFDTGSLPGVLGGELLLGWVTMSGPSSSVTQDPTFAPVPLVSVNALTLFPAFKLAPSAGSFNFSGTIGASEQWIAEIESWRIAAPTPTPTPVPTPTPTPVAVPAVPTLAPRGMGALAAALAIVGVLLARRLLQ